MKNKKLLFIQLNEINFEYIDKYIEDHNLENLKKIGSIGEIIDVKRGYARNFLIANKKALYASKENISQVEKIKAELSKKDNEKKQAAKKILDLLNKGHSHQIIKLITQLKGHLRS